MKFVHDARAEKCVIQFATALAEESLHTPLRPKPMQRLAPVDRIAPADADFACNGAQSAQSRFARPLRCKHDDRRGVNREHVRGRINGALARDENAKVELGPTRTQTHPPVACAAGAERYAVQVRCARAAHHGIRCGAKFQKVLLVACAAER